MSSAQAPCHGVKVVEFATMVSGPYGGQILAELGADVVKIEPLHGEPLRMIRPYHHGMSGMFMQFNRNKRSIAIDLKNTEGQKIARDLALGADVVLENNRAGVMERLGLDYASLSAINAGLIFLQITGFGEKGRYADRPAYEHLLQGMSGLMRLQGRHGQDPIQGIQNMIVDKSSGLMAANAILAALLHRQRTGMGQRIGLSLLGAVAAFGLPEQIGGHTFLSAEAAPIPNPNTFFPVRASDGHVIGYLQQRAHFVGLCRTFGREDLLDDPRFATDRDIFGNLAEVWAEMGIAAASVPARELVETAARHGVPLALVNDVTEFFDDAHVCESGIFTYVEDELLGRVRQISYPARFSGCSPPADRLAPGLGADTEALLTNMGYASADIARLRTEGIVA